MANAQTSANSGSPASSTSLDALMEHHKALSAGFHTPFTLRMHRSLSWLKRAEAAGSDDDVAFICLWIAFNAAYAQDTGGTDITSERQTFRDFVGQVCHLDADKALWALVWQVFPGPIRVLLDNQYVFQPFWDALNNPHSDGSVPQHWREAFADARQRVQRALTQQDTERVLYEVFVRLYTLRNQLMHGGATWNSSVNRAQVRDGRALLARLLPVVLGVMMSNSVQFDSMVPSVNRWLRRRKLSGRLDVVRDDLHNPRESVVVRIGMGHKASFCRQ